MARRSFIYPLLAVLLGIVATYFKFGTENAITTTKRPNTGRNNTVLFLSDSHHGLANVLLATSHALLTNHPQVEVHYASFPKLAKSVAKISTFAQEQSPSSRPITFHALPGPSYGEALNSQGHYIQETIGHPGIKGVERLCSTMQDYLMPWSGPEYLALYEAVLKILDEVNPAVVAIDPMFGAGVDATRAQNRSHAIISPNSLKDNFVDKQPNGALFWKYPAIGSGIPYPVPWHQIPTNIYITLRFAYSVLVAPKLWSKRSFLRANGIAKPSDVFSIYQPDLLWLSQALPEADFPIPVVPANVIPTGPIFLSTASAAEQDPELAEWMGRAPTVLINLGSTMDYDEQGTKEMSSAVKTLLSQSDVQVLWKFNKRHSFPDTVFESVTDEISTRRLRLEKWINIDPAAMLETGNIAVSVHHGGANCYWEAVGTGIPHIILPQWADLYDYATRVEYLNIGIWGSKLSAPAWSAAELSAAFFKIVGNATEAQTIRENAKRLGEIAKVKPGRVRAAEEIARLAGEGVIER